MILKLLIACVAVASAGAVLAPCSSTCPLGKDFPCTSETGRCMCTNGAGSTMLCGNGGETNVPTVSPTVGVHQTGAPMPCQQSACLLESGELLLPSGADPRRCYVNPVTDSCQCGTLNVDNVLLPTPLATCVSFTGVTECGGVCQSGQVGKCYQTSNGCRCGVRTETSIVFSGLCVSASGSPTQSPTAAAVPTKCQTVCHLKSGEVITSEQDARKCYLTGDVCTCGTLSPNNQLTPVQDATCGARPTTAPPTTAPPTTAPPTTAPPTTAPAMPCPESVCKLGTGEVVMAATDARKCYKSSAAGPCQCATLSNGKLTSVSGASCVQKPTPCDAMQCRNMMPGQCYRVGDGACMCGSQSVEGFLTLSDATCEPKAPPTPAPLPQPCPEKFCKLPNGTLYLGGERVPRCYLGGDVAVASGAAPVVVGGSAASTGTVGASCVCGLFDDVKLTFTKIEQAECVSAPTLCRDLVCPTSATSNCYTTPTGCFCGSVADGALTLSSTKCVPPVSYDACDQKVCRMLNSPTASVPDGKCYRTVSGSSISEDCKCRRAVSGVLQEVAGTVCVDAVSPTTAPPTSVPTSMPVPSLVPCPEYTCPLPGGVVGECFHEQGSDNCNCYVKGSRVNGRCVRKDATPAPTPAVEACPMKQCPRDVQGKCFHLTLVPGVKTAGSGGGIVANPVVVGGGGDDVVATLSTVANVRFSWDGNFGAGNDGTDCFCVVGGLPFTAAAVIPAYGRCVDVNAPTPVPTPYVPQPCCTSSECKCTIGDFPCKRYAKDSNYCSCRDESVTPFRVGTCEEVTDAPPTAAPTPAEACDDFCPSSADGKGCVRTGLLAGAAFESCQCTSGGSALSNCYAQCQAGVCPNAAFPCYSVPTPTGGTRCQCNVNQVWQNCTSSTPTPPPTPDVTTLGEFCVRSQCPGAVGVEGEARCRKRIAKGVVSRDCFCHPFGMDSPVQCVSECASDSACPKTGLPCVERPPVPGVSAGTACACAPKERGGDWSHCPPPPFTPVVCGGSCGADAPEQNCTIYERDGDCECRFVKASADGNSTQFITRKCAGSGDPIGTPCPGVCPSDAAASAVGVVFDGCVWQRPALYSAPPVCACSLTGKQCVADTGSQCPPTAVCPFEAVNVDGVVYRPECDPNNCTCAANGKSEKCVAPSQLCEADVKCTRPRDNGVASADHLCNREDWRRQLALDFSDYGHCMYGACTFENKARCVSSFCSKKENTGARCSCTCACPSVTDNNEVYACESESATPCPGLTCDLQARQLQSQCGEKQLEPGTCRNGLCHVALGGDAGRVAICRKANRTACATDGDGCTCDCACMGQLSPAEVQLFALPLVISDEVAARYAYNTLFASECVREEPPTGDDECSPFDTTPAAVPCDQAVRCGADDTTGDRCKPTKKGVCAPSGGYCVVDGCAACANTDECAGASVDREQPAVFAARNCSCKCACQKSAADVISFATATSGRRLRLLTTCTARADPVPCDPKARTPCPTGLCCMNGVCMPCGVVVGTDATGVTAVAGVDVRAVIGNDFASDFGITVAAVANMGDEAGGALAGAVRELFDSKAATVHAYSIDYVCSLAFGRRVHVTVIDGVRSVCLMAAAASDADAATPDPLPCVGVDEASLTACVGTKRSTSSADDSVTLDANVPAEDGDDKLVGACSSVDAANKQDGVDVTVTQVTDADASCRGDAAVRQLSNTRSLSEETAPAEESGNRVAKKSNSALYIGLGVAAGVACCLLLAAVACFAMRSRAGKGRRAAPARSSSVRGTGAPARTASRSNMRTSRRDLSNRHDVGVVNPTTMKMSTIEMSTISPRESQTAAGATMAEVQRPQRRMEYDSVPV